MVLDTPGTLAGSQHRNGTPQSGETPLLPLRRCFLSLQPFTHSLRAPQARHLPQFQLRRQTHFLYLPRCRSFFFALIRFSLFGSAQPPQANNDFAFCFGFGFGFPLPRAITVRVGFGSAAAAFGAVGWERRFGGFGHVGG